MARAPWPKRAGGVGRGVCGGWALGRCCICCICCIFKLAGGRRQSGAAIASHIVVRVEEAKLCQAQQCQAQRAAVGIDKVSQARVEFGTFAWRCEMAAVARDGSAVGLAAWQLRIFSDDGSTTF